MNYASCDSECKITILYEEDSQLDNYLKQNPFEFLIISGEASFTNFIKTSASNYKVDIDVITTAQIELPTLYYKGYEITLISNIIGEFFDNAIYETNLTKEKELHLDFFLEDENLKLVLSNTCKETVNISMITKNGYSTKGRNRGFGLYDIEQSIKLVNTIKVEYKFFDNYFVAFLSIRYLKNKI